MTSRLLLAALLATSAVACAPKPKESKISRDVKIVKEENEPSKLFERGKAFHAIGDLTRAEQYYAAAMQSGYPEAKVLPLLLRVCIEGNHYQVAIDYAEPVLKKTPADHKLRLLVASLYTAVGQHSKARAHYERVLVDHPDEATAHYALGVLLRDEFHDRVGADLHFREYLRVAPDGAHVEEAKGSLLKEVSSAPTLPGPATAPTASAAPGPTPLASPGTKPKGDKPLPVKLP